MRVKELIERLSKLDQELFVLAEDNDHWFYNTSSVTTGFVSEGRNVDHLIDDEDMPEDAELCALIRS